MDSLKFAKRLFLIGGFAIAILILCYQFYEYQKFGKWDWLVLADIFPTWTENLTPEESSVQAFAYWFIAELWLGALAIIQGVLGFFFARRDDSDFTDLGGFE